MLSKPSHSKKKPMTIENLAVAIESDFAQLRNVMSGLRDGMGVVRSTMATKQDLADLRDEIGERFATHSGLQSVVSKAKEELMEEIGKIKYAKEIDELRARVQRVEHDLGIKSRRGAA
jgi:hypothetical protein